MNNYNQVTQLSQMFYLYFLDDDDERQYVCHRGYRDYQVVYGHTNEPDNAYLFSGVPDNVKLMLERRFHLVNLVVESARN